jgi:hypothetical protein
MHTKAQVSEAKPIFMSKKLRERYSSVAGHNMRWVMIRREGLPKFNEEKEKVLFEK